MSTASDVRAAAEQIHDALDAADDGFHDRDTGVVDTTSGQLAAALLAAGWRPPAADETVGALTGSEGGGAA